MNYWLMQLRQKDNERFPKEKIIQILTGKYLIGVGDNDKNSVRRFRHEMKIDDIIAIKSGNDPVALVKVIGNYYYDKQNVNDELDWFEHRRKIKLLDIYKEKYDFNLPIKRGILNLCINLNTQTSKTIIYWYKKASIPIALKCDWKFSDISKPHKIDFSIQFTDQQFEQLTYGHLAREMEDKWFIFFENNWLYFNRSWTGYCMYKILLSKENNEKYYSIKEFWVERNNELYRCTDDQHDLENLLFLISRVLLKNNSFNINSRILDPNENPIRLWSEFGSLIIDNSGNE